jgi:UDP-glucose 4-epimerase
MILITGSAGYIGSHLSYYFEKKGIEYIGIDNLAFSYKSNIICHKKHYFFDISDKNKIKELIVKFDITTVIHCAASSYVLEVEKNKKKSYLNNIVKTKKFIETCSKNKIENFIFLSSSNVYEEKKKDIALSEISKTNPKNFYGKNKLEIENFLKEKKFNKLFILRLFNIIGLFNSNFKPFKFKKKNYQRLIFKLIQNIKKKKITEINYLRDQGRRKFPSRDFVNISDFVKIIEKILDKINQNKKTHKVLNIASNKSIKIDKIINVFKKKYKDKLKLKYNKITKKELLFTKGTNYRLYKFINFIPKTTLKNILKTYHA